MNDKTEAVIRHNDHNTKDATYSRHYRDSYLLHLQQAQFSYNCQESALVQLDELAINHNDKIVILGKNGAGKTTLLKLLVGELTWCNNTHSHPSGKTDVFRTGYIPQNLSNFFLTDKVFDEIALGLLLQNKHIPHDELSERVHIALDKVSGLGLIGRRIEHLSGGEKRKVAIATLVAINPDLLLLDEPDDELDMQAVLSMGKLISHLRSAVVLTTHNPIMAWVAGHKHAIYMMLPARGEENLFLLDNTTAYRFASELAKYELLPNNSRIIERWGDLLDAYTHYLKFEQ